MFGFDGRFRHAGRGLFHAATQPQALAFVPAFMLGGQWLGGEAVMMVLAMSLPALVLLGKGDTRERRAAPEDGLTGLATRSQLLARLNEVLENFEGRGQSTIVFVVQIDDFAELSENLGSAGAEAVIRQTAERVNSVVRPGDIAARLIDHRFALCLSPIRQASVEIGVRVAERLQAAIAEPMALDAATLHISASVGFCLTRRAPERRPEVILEAAEIAMDDARRAGSGSIRAYSPEMREALQLRSGMAEDILKAFDRGQIRAWFQPQIAVESGRVSGVEALARWQHPVRGTLPPGDFLETIEAAGLLERLGEVMLTEGLTALRRWDAAGYRVPRIGINFSAAELRNPRLLDRIRWELDRFDLTADRLAVEILETVVAETGNDTIGRNIAGLATMGCMVDLDDFGTGHASIAHIRRFAVSRIKIDRSFVTHVDSDPGQRRMVAAILSMAAELGLETLGEGVETGGELATLQQLGCTHLQGFHLARPMSFADTSAWLAAERDHRGAPEGTGLPGV
ncbi:bifunctional diguanylate cyclase/phosphodiesterase [Tropicimonas sp. IMCC34043]|uniref:putative bifunctional diguanylate cyclase/phosphodiesterase n=1 Tax=Tropicimonas sp. IMCC34043 TaxID=2248760 RepID=UPI000E239CA8|nr:bifunctional diguanylate cyclase/phosphodiesterase [Tropicimonas sp. IMCC34043]